MVDSAIPSPGESQSQNPSARSRRLGARLRHNWQYLLGVAILVGALAGVVLTTRQPATDADSAESQMAPTADVGTPAPPITLTNVDGNQVSLAQLQGRVVLVNFWATWCVPCRGEMPTLQQLSADLANQPFSVLEVDLQEDAPAVRAFEQQLGLKLPTVLDTDGVAAEAYGVRALPASFLVDRSGVLREKRLGAILDGPASTTWSAAWVQQRVQALVGS